MKSYYELKIEIEVMQQQMVDTCFTAVMMLKGYLTKDRKKA